MIEDNELIQKFINGDETGFDELVRRYQQRIYALLYRLVHNPEDAREVSQDVFVRVYQALPRFQGKSSFYTWLYRIAVNCAFNCLRSRRRRQARVDNTVPLDEELDAQLPSGEMPEDNFRQGEIRRAVRAAVDTLPERQRAVFIMRQYDGLSNDEIEKVLGLSTGAVKSHYFLAVHKLQVELKEWAQ
jgi:RNA polymerase sigma-70 factor, ECF subfamily